jgi:hypothetical protein
MNFGILEEVEVISGRAAGGKRIESHLEDVLQNKSSTCVSIAMAADLLREYPDLVERPRENFTVLDQLIEHLESKIFFAGEADELVFRLRRDDADLKLLNDAYCSWETALEQIFVARVCSERTLLLHDYRLNNRFQRLLRRETSMLTNRNAQRALFIGSGPFPITAIWLHRILGIPVDGLDLSQDAVARSRELIGYLRMDGAINIIHESSPTYDVSSYDVIVIALLAKPKQAILDNIHKSAKTGCEIICRTSFGLRSVVYEPTIVSEEILEKFSLDDARVISGNCDDTISSLLLRTIR